MDLIQRCRTGDEEAFAELFHQHKNLVYKTASLLLGDAAAAEDALQEVFVKVYSSLDTFDARKGAFTTWLRRITVNHCLNVRRQGRPSPFSLEDLAVGGSLPAERRCSFLPEEWAVDRERAEAIWWAVQNLSPSLRATVVLRYIRGTPLPGDRQTRLDIRRTTVWSAQKPKGRQGGEENVSKHVIRVPKDT